jgi:CheY-like chemotaxis protein
VDTARDGAEGIRKVRKLRPDAVVMDLMMPGLDGWKATRELKADPRTRDIVIVVLSGRVTPDALQAARAAGADEVLTKPCLPEDLFETIRRHLIRRA